MKRKGRVEQKKEVVKEVKSSIKFTAPVIKKDAEVKPRRDEDSGPVDADQDRYRCP